MDIPSDPTLPEQKTRLRGNRPEEKTEEASWFAMEAAIPSGTHRVQGDCPFPVRFTEIFLPHGAIVSGPTGRLTVGEGKYRIVYPDPLESETSWIVIFRDEHMTTQDNTSHPGGSSNGTSAQPAEETLQRYIGSQPYRTSSEKNIFNHEAMVDEASPVEGPQVTYDMENGNEGFFDEAIGAIDASLAFDFVPETLADRVEAMDVDSTPEQQNFSEFQNYECTCQKFEDIFNAAIVPENDPEQLRQAVLDKEQLKNFFKFHTVNPAWPKPPSLADPRVHPQTPYPQDSARTKPVGPFENMQNRGFLTIRLPTIYRVYSTVGTLTSFDVPFYDGKEQAGGGVYAFYLPTSPPTDYELPCLHPGVMAAFDLSKDHKLWRDGKFIPINIVKGPHEIMYVDGKIEILDCRDSSCLLKDACGQGEALTSQDRHDGAKDPDKNTNSEETDDSDSRGTDGQRTEVAGDKNPRENNEQTLNDVGNEREETTDGEWDCLPKHMRPPQHRRAVMTTARGLLRPHRDWLYNEAKKEKKAEEEKKKDKSEEAEKERKRVQKEEFRRESELHRQAAYREKTRQKRERDRWAQQKREADEREFAAMMQQQEAAGGTQTRRTQRRTARVAVDYREKVAIQSGSSEEDSNKDESGSTDSSGDGEA